MFDLAAIQAALVEARVDGWLLYDFRGSNPLARRILDLPEQPVSSRRFLYFVPAQGEPVKLVHRIEERVLDHLPGRTHRYLAWQEWESLVAQALAGRRRVAMEYSPRSAIPYIARLDAGLVEMVRSYGVDVVSSGDLVQVFEAAWDDEQWQMHCEAAVHTQSAFERAYALIADHARRGELIRETQVQAEIMNHFQRHGLVTSHPPIVAVGPHSGDPHYEPGSASDAMIRAGDFVLIDLWAKLDRPRSVYSDLTQVAFVGESVPARNEEVFQIVAAGRDAALDTVRRAFATNTPLPGWQVDQAARDVIAEAGYGERFIHRTGHSIGQETHGNGANMDNLETHDERLVMRRTCFSIEPGIYLNDFGVRSEINVFIDAAGAVHVTGGPPQTHVRAIRAQ